MRVDQADLPSPALVVPADSAVRAVSVLVTQVGGTAGIIGQIGLQLLRTMTPFKIRDSHKKYTWTAGPAHRGTMYLQWCQEP